ncbi:MAG: hypothetical protein AAF517_02920 [Planctomycetota bacterium]
MFLVSHEDTALFPVFLELSKNVAHRGFSGVLRGQDCGIPSARRRPDLDIVPRLALRDTLSVASGRFDTVVTLFVRMLDVNFVGRVGCLYCSGLRSVGRVPSQSILIKRSVEAVLIELVVVSLHGYLWTNVDRRRRRANRGRNVRKVDLAFGNGGEASTQPGSQDRCEYSDEHEVLRDV